MRLNYIDRIDCLEGMKAIPDGSVDLILCDLPYGTTSSKWDKVIPFEPLWEQYKRVLKPNGVAALFGAEPFASRLRLSNLEWYKYDWVWVKTHSVGFVNAKLRPMSKHEVICIFSEGKTSNGNKNNMPYFPQGLIPYGKEMRSGNKKGKDNTYWRPSLQSSNEGGYIQQFTNYPTTILNFAKDHPAVHPTQKPVALLEYLIKTYTQPGAVVLDNCVGSGSTPVACIRTGRNYIGFELNEEYHAIATDRVAAEEGPLWQMINP